MLKSVILKNFINELKWRGMVQDIIPGTEEKLIEGSAIGYIGFDPTSDSLHIGSLVQILILKHFQMCGHKPIFLIGGATGMIGDPSGKSSERNLLSEAELKHNIKAIKKQLSKFLDFDSKDANAAIIFDNSNWFDKINLIDFIRDYGKFLTVNYMIAKDSVKNRIYGDSRDGMSFTEFTYQIIQAYDFFHLNKNHNCIIQMGGSDQWGNITSGVELIRKKTSKKVFAMTCPLITKSDGSKFGKTEEGNVWLDKKKTSPYKFYQYWLNISDEDAINYIKIFTFNSKSQVEEYIKEHQESPHIRLIQKLIAKYLTKLVHSQNDLDNAINASNILFGKSTSKDLSQLDEDTFLDVFEGVPKASLKMKLLQSKPSIIDLIQKTGFLKSKSEITRSLKENSISVNKEKVNINSEISSNNLICKKYIVLQRGKKNYFLVTIEH